MCLMCVECWIPYSGKVWQWKSLANLLVLSIWWKKFAEWIDSAMQKVIIVGRNLDDFSLANHGYDLPNSPNFLLA